MGNTDNAASETGRDIPYLPTLQEAIPAGLNDTDPVAETAPVPETVKEDTKDVLMTETEKVMCVDRKIIEDKNAGKDRMAIDNINNTEKDRSDADNDRNVGKDRIAIDNINNTGKDRIEVNNSIGKDRVEIDNNIEKKDNSDEAKEPMAKTEVQIKAVVQVKQDLKDQAMQIGSPSNVEMAGNEKI